MVNLKIQIGLEDGYIEVFLPDFYNQTDYKFANIEDWLVNWEQNNNCTAIFKEIYGMSNRKILDILEQFRLDLDNGVIRIEKNIK